MVSTDPPPFKGDTDRIRVDRKAARGYQISPAVAGWVYVLGRPVMEAVFSCYQPQPLGRAIFRGVFLRCAQKSFWFFWTVLFRFVILVSERILLMELFSRIRYVGGCVKNHAVFRFALGMWLVFQAPLFLIGFWIGIHLK